MSEENTKKAMLNSRYLDNLVKELVLAVHDEGFEVNYRNTRLADGYVDYEDKARIIIGRKNRAISELHEYIHVLYDEIFGRTGKEKELSEKDVEKTARKLLRY